MSSKFPKPFYRTARNAWFVQIAGKQSPLGPDEEAAHHRYHQIMGQPRQAPSTATAGTVLATLDAFLDWCQKNKVARTYDWYRGYLESFASTIPARLTPAQFKPYHVQQWLDANPRWKTGKRGAVIAVTRIFNWAVRMGLIEANPIRSIEKPKAGRREHVIAPEQYATILATVRDSEFRDLLMTCWETGCRPQEVLSVEARHVDLANGCWEFPVDESKGKKRQRIVYLTDTALAITRRLMDLYPSGPLFRNTDGLRWTPSALNCRFARLRVALGRKAAAERGLTPPKIKRLTKGQRSDETVRAVHQKAMMERRRKIAETARKLMPRYSLYTFRHSCCTFRD